MPKDARRNRDNYEKKITKYHEVDDYFLITCTTNAVIYEAGY